MNHQLSRLPDGQYTCALCRWTWRAPPRSACFGVPRYAYGSWPQGLYTTTQLRRMHLKPADEPDGYYPLLKSPYHRYLYDITKAAPRRVPTNKQCEAITKMRMALVQKYTCLGCGRFDGNHGRSRSGVMNGYCGNCWREIHHRTRQADVCSWAKAYLDHGDFIVLDSETTGLRNEDEVIELALVHSSGAVLFSSLIQPQNSQRPDLATPIHGITGAMLSSAPRFLDVWPLITAILRRYRRVLVYNAAFDHRLLDATASRYGLRAPGSAWECLMEQYAVYHGAWSSYYGSYTWQSLSTACSCLGVDVPGASHRAVTDALAALGVLQALASLDGQIELYPVPEREPAHDVPGDDHPF